MIQELQNIFKYTDISFQQIYNRRGHSLLKLKRYADSKEAFKKCTDWIGKSDMNQVMRDKWRVKLKKQMGVFGVVKQVSLG